MLYLLELSCGHKAITSVELKLQYPKTDTHVIYCPTCRHNDACDYHKRLPTAWNEVTSYREAPVDQPELLLMLKRDALVLPRDVMRLQPTVPRSRIRPFPYVK
jgi:hypothetical protein